MAPPRTAVLQRVRSFLTCNSSPESSLSTAPWLPRRCMLLSGLWSHRRMSAAYDDCAGQPCSACSVTDSLDWWRHSAISDSSNARLASMRQPIDGPISRARTGRPRSPLSATPERDNAVVYEPWGVSRWTHHMRSVKGAPQDPGLLQKRRPRGRRWSTLDGSHGSVVRSGQLSPVRTRS